MAFKKKGNQEAVKAFYDLYYQPDQVNALHQGRGLPAGHQVRPAGSSRRDAEAEGLPRRRCRTRTSRPTDDPTWDKVKLAVQQNIGARSVDGDPKGARRPPEDGRDGG